MNAAFRRLVGAATLLAAAFLAAPTTTAHAAPARPDFQLPFPCGETWRGHSGPDHSPSTNAIDWNNNPDEGDPVVASAAGTVELRDAGNRSYGKHIIITHSGGWKTLYAHLSAFSIADGATVRTGQQIGRVGQTGGAQGAHLHYEQKYGGDVMPAVFDGVPYRYPDQAVKSHNCGEEPAPPTDPGPTCTGAATVYGVAGDSTLTVSQLADPAHGGRRSFGAKVIGTLPFTAKTLVALDYNTLFATDGNSLYKIEVINFSDTNGSVKVSTVDTGGWTQEHLAYDGYGHLYGVANGQLRRYDLAGGTYGIVRNTLLGDSGWVFATVTGAANGWMLATTTAGELVSYDLDPIARHSLRPRTWVFQNLVSPGGGVYYAQDEDGALYHYVDRDPTDGKGSDISAGKLIDKQGWTQRLLTAQPRVCTT
jgi:hypothetical protein